MTYKSLLTIITDEDGMEKPLAAAIALAGHYDAHLDVVCIAAEPMLAGYDFPSASGILTQDMLGLAREKVAAIEKVARGILAHQNIRWGVESMVVPTGGLAEAVAQYARFSDLALQAKPYTMPNRPEAEAAIEAVLFDAGVPVMVMPDGPMPAIPGKRIVVAWNQSREAMVAVRAAMPLLMAAEQVTIMIVDPAAYGAERSNPGGALSQMLARHGVRAEVTVLAKTLPRFCDMLNRHARDRAADMVVMGAYGHSRLRESILGGATRGMLEQAEMPVFMAH